MSSVSQRLAALRGRIESARSENLKAVERESLGSEAYSHNEQKTLCPAYSDGGKISPNSENKTFMRKRLREVDVGSADEADDEDEDVCLRSMKRRARASVPNAAYHEERCSSSTEPHNASVLVYGGKAPVSEGAVDRMVAELQRTEKRREKFRRRRSFYEDEADITFINEGNRLFNRTLEKHFDKFDSVKEIKENLERGTA